MPEDGSVGARVTWSCVAWWPHSGRSQAFANGLGAKLHRIYYSWPRPRVLAPLRYTLQAMRTLRILFKEHPQAVHVQNPPFVCGLVVYLYCVMSGASFVLDHHSAVFARVWDWALPIQRFLARRALANIVTSQKWADRIHTWTASSIIITVSLMPLPPGHEHETEPGFNIAYVCTFAPDEPYREVVRASRHLPDVHFFITGQADSAAREALNSLPPNVTLTGFLPDAQYAGLLRSVDAVMVLTTRDNTMQMGGCEAVSAGKPLITSDWPYLHEVFPKGTVYAANTRDGICDAVTTLQNEHRVLNQEMIQFRDEIRHRWREQIDRLDALAATYTYKDGPVWDS